MSRTAARALAAFAALAAVVLGLLVTGAAPGDAPVAVVAGATADAGEPGCGPGHPVGEGAAGPVVPPRAHGFGELLTSLAAGRPVCGYGAADALVRDLAPGPEPPELVPPSPPELSVLRV
ncbi:MULTISPECIES: hypothetical protein [Streptomyces]|uniref:DUF732 domain-containing protein n=1 Tax=Streptomyces solicathayae TaxID=3081768 RepID=A0ABZ0LXF5_9ACTN|nr:hypothetical protein [Streptomyces sp. HUAS YS2]WOX23459.1 hypothetical protein R2D22_19520 [Streptomyces sp. HUAS YS2]